MQSKLRNQCEGNFVAKKLSSLRRRITSVACHSMEKGDVETLSVSAFQRVMNDDRIHEILCELGVDSMNKYILHDLFANSATVSVAELLSAVGRIRGETKQCAVEAVLLTRNLNSGFLEFQASVGESLRALE